MKLSTVRKIHTFSSLIVAIMLLLYLFSGVLLNHKEIVFDDDGETQELFQNIYESGGISLGLRNVGVNLTPNQLDDLKSGGEIRFRKPGSQQSVYLDGDLLVYESTKYGVLSWLADFHANKYVSDVWPYAIDVLALLALLSLVSGVYIGYKNKKYSGRNIRLFSAGFLIVCLAMVV